MGIATITFDNGKMMVFDYLTTNYAIGGDPLPTADIYDSGGNDLDTGVYLSVNNLGWVGRIAHVTETLVKTVPGVGVLSVEPIIVSSPGNNSVAMYLMVRDVNSRYFIFKYVSARLNSTVFPVRNPTTDTYGTCYTAGMYYAGLDINPFIYAEVTDYVSVVTNDPYSQGGFSSGGGGQGTFDGTGDDIGIPGLPTLSAVDAGFITLFNPSVAQLASLAAYMWSNPLFDLDAWKKVFADPMDAILGLSIVPVDVPAGGAKAVTVGNISTGVSMTTAASQYVEVDCGSLDVEEYWGAYLDYDPYTKAEIYLPYVGTHPLSVDDIMGKTVHVVYHIDILSGACCAYVQCGGSVLYSFLGQCASSIPITGDNWTNVINGAITIAGSIGSMVATGGASAPMAATAIASTVVNTMKPSIEKSGAMGGTGGMMGVQTPYLIITRPRQALPEDQNALMGYPSFITKELGAVIGYTEIDSIHLEGLSATAAELSEIEMLLKGGVIF